MKRPSGWSGQDPTATSSINNLVQGNRIEAPLLQHQANPAIQIDDRQSGLKISPAPRESRASVSLAYCGKSNPTDEYKPDAAAVDAMLHRVAKNPDKRAFLLRFAERQFLALLFQLPLRFTRFEPVHASHGFAIVPFFKPHSTNATAPDFRIAPPLRGCCVTIPPRHHNASHHE